MGGRGRSRAAPAGVAASTLAKTVLTGAALAATSHGRMLGKKIELASSTDPQEAEEAAGSFDAGRRTGALPTRSGWYRR
ncbi:hypothetical protein ABZ802_30085 [Streptomyces sp. NPDC047737]|uniref:hypothetical protein n=1 Tax=unclassified Streptomyces TaxID=2593676 RepID=UPI0033CE7FD4